jgi:hypothetical protein
MIEALGLEIATIKKSGGSTTVELFNGTLVSESNGTYIYRFPLKEELQLRDDTPIRIHFGQQETDGSIVSVGEGVLVLALEENLGTRLPHVRLIADDSFLVERLRDRLQQVQSGEARFNMAAASRVIGASPIKPGKAQVSRRILDGKPPLNEQQVEAVSLSLAGDTTFVWGPPGTGKTTVLARIMEAHYFTGRSVLLVSNTNIAVDTAMEKIAERLKTEPEFQTGAVLRFGPVVKEELRQKFGDQVILDNVVARLSQSLQQELSVAQAEALRLSHTVQQLRDMIRQHEQAASIEAELKREQDSQARLGSQLQDLTNQLQTHAVVLQRLRHDLERASTMGTVRRFFSGLNLERLRQHIAQTEMQQRTMSDARRAAESEYASTESNIQRLEAQIRDLSSRIRDLPPLDQCKARLASADNRSKGLEQRIAELQKQIEQVRQEVLNRCRILATTVYRTYLKGQVERQFDVVVIDEASMLMLPMSFYAAGLTLQSVTVAGDFRQLPAIVLSNEPHAVDWLKTDVFCKAGIPQQVATKQLPPHLAALRVQYRMREAICQVTNELFYSDHRLSTDASVDLREASRLPLGRSPLLYVDTASLHPWASMKLGTYSRYNLLHALLTKKMVVHLSERNYLRADDTSNEQIGVVAPYSAQTRLIQAFLEDALGQQFRHFAATVHRFQGNEKDTMLVDLTDSTGCRLGKFMKGIAVEDDGSRLLNVAISRARDHVVLIANFEYLRKRAPNNGIVIKLLNLFETHGTALDIETILPLGDEDWLDGLHKIISPNIELTDDQWGVFSEATFYPAFARDLESAKKSIVILSPFLTSRGVGRWANYFHVALQRDIPIRIVTRPSAEFGGASEEEINETFEKLRELGVVVDLRGRMHEKVAIIDEKIAWHGSLNILSHRDTSELMIRLTGTAACQRLIDLISPLIQRRRDAAGVPSDSENPLCSKCDAPTVLYDGRYGVYFECPRCKVKIDPRHQPSKRKGDKPPMQGNHDTSTRDKVETGHPCPRPNCNGQMVERRGRFGPFLGCSNFPKCRKTQPF